MNKDSMNFCRSVAIVSEQLSALPKKVHQVIDNLETICRVKNKITVKEWRVRSGEVHVTFRFPKSVIDLTKEQGWIKDTFKDCHITGKLVEIPFSSL